MEDLQAETVARWLAENVFLDLCGFPAVLRCDRGQEYTSDLVKSLNDRFGVEQCFGAAFHPEAQAHVEGSHQRVNAIIKAYTDATKHWARWIKVAQWSMRATPRHDLGGFSPFEVVSGMQP